MIKTTRRHQQNRIGLPRRLKSNKQTIQKSIELDLAPIRLSSVPGLKNYDSPK